MNQRMKKFVAFGIALFAAAVLVCANIPAEAAAKAPKKITLTATTKTVDLYGKATVSVKSVTPANASKAVTFKSSNEKIATVTNQGVVTGKKAGSVTITATSKVNKKVKATIKLTVKNLKPTSINLNKSVAAMTVGSTTSLKATVKPVSVYCPVYVTSSNKSVATISGGVITAKKPGTTVITAKTKYPNSKGKYLTATCTVTVVDEVETRDVFVSPEWVQCVLDDQVEGYEDAFISEVSWGSLEGATAYKNGHVPTAYHINSDSVEYDDCDPWPMGNGVDDFELYEKADVHPQDNFNIRSADQLAVFLKNNNITKDTKVILYGASASNSAVTRVAYAMIYAGVEDVKVINGGWKAWEESGLPVEKGVNEQKAGGDDYSFGTTIPANEQYYLTLDQTRDKLATDPNFRLVSIRSLDEFVGNTTGYGYIDDGNEGEPLGAVWGKDTDDGTYVKDGKVVSFEDMNAMLKSTAGTDVTVNEVSFYCGTGWRATIPFLIAYEAGYDNITLYDGGWWQWQLNHFGFAKEEIPTGTVEAQPEKYPIQTVSPRTALNYAELTFKDAKVEVKEGETAKNELSVFPARVTDITYTSSDESVATVAADGTITAVGEGTAIIKAATKAKCTDTFKIVVTK